jgi:hypothetical protein
MKGFDYVSRFAVCRQHPDGRRPAPPYGGDMGLLDGGNTPTGSKTRVWRNDGVFNPVKHGRHAYRKKAVVPHS